MDHTKMSLRSNLSLEKIFHSIKKLRMAAGVMHVVAHPDDEDIGLLAYLSHKYGVRAVCWSATRGEGGQNRIGSYSGDALGVYRTWETLAAREEDGSEAFFGPFYDFGYSKNAEEAFSKWGEEKVVRELVRAIRIIKPAVIVSRWVGGPGDQHGHHQAIGIAARKAFDAAGDPKMFTELEKEGLAPWKPQKLYYSTDNTGGDYSAGAAFNLFGKKNKDMEKAGALSINTGEMDVVSGKTYQERAWTAYNRHQTQAIGVAPGRGDFFYYFLPAKNHVTKDPVETGFFDGFDPTLAGLSTLINESEGSGDIHKLLSATTTLVDKALEEMRAGRPHEASDGLLEGLPRLKKAVGLIEKLDAPSFKKSALREYIREKCDDFELAIANCLGLELECLSSEYKVTPGQKFTVNCKLWNHRLEKISGVKLSVELPKKWKKRSIDTSKDKSCESKSYEISTDTMSELSCPYWLVNPREGNVYNWPEGGPSGLPFAPPQARAFCSFTIGETKISLTSPILHRSAFPGGYREMPLLTTPSVELRPSFLQTFVSVSEQSREIRLQLTATNNRREKINGKMYLKLPERWKSEPSSINISLAESGSSKTGGFQIVIPEGAPEGLHKIECRIRQGRRDYYHCVNPVRMASPGLPGPPDSSNCIKEANIIYPAEVKVSLIDVQFAPEQQYAYVPGVIENIRETLLPVGIEFTELSGPLLACENLEQFDVIVIGPDAYNINEDLRSNGERFLEFALNGGTLVVLYQRYGYQGKGFAPYEFRYNQPHDRVTVEEAGVTILKPEHALFNFPNEINAGDFEGWVYDRGMYFFGEWDKRYHPLLSSADPGEEQLKGGLLSCQYGKGNFIYAAYSFHRQLPAGVLGAFRLFANLLGLKAARTHERVKFLKKIDLFAEFDDASLEAISKLMFERWAHDGTILCEEGDKGDELYLIYSGKIEVIDKKKGKEIVIAVLGAGTIVGEMALLAHIPRTKTLRARGDTELLVLKGSDFQSIIIENSSLSLKLLEMLVRRLAAK